MIIQNKLSTYPAQVKTQYRLNLKAIVQDPDQLNAQSNELSYEDLYAIRLGNKQGRNVKSMWIC